MTHLWKNWGTEKHGASQTARKWRKIRKAKYKQLLSLTGVLALTGTAFVATGTAAQAADTADLVTNPAQYVDPFIGTAKSETTNVVSDINNFPGAAVPFGMVQYSPDTTGSYAGYSYLSDTITGFSLNHASAGCYVFGDVPVLPTTKDIGSSPKNTTEKYTHDGEEAEPGYYKVNLTDSNINAELTSTNRVAIGKYDYPDNGKTGVFHIRAAGSKNGNSDAAIYIDPDSNTVYGSTTTGSFCGKNNKYTLYYAMEFSTDFTTYGTYSGSDVQTGSTERTGNSAGGWINFPAGTNVEVRTGVSYTSVENARANLQAEAAWTTDFDQIQQASYQQWDQALNKIKVASDKQDDLNTFYTLLYHSLQHPNTFSDHNGDYLGYDNQVHNVSENPGQETQYANFSDWDTYRSLAALQAMLFPDEASDMAQSLVNAAEQSGSFPRWAVANGATGQMTGDSVVPLIINMYEYGATDFDVETALEYMVKAAKDGGPALSTSTNPTYKERPGAETYNELGYAPQTEEFRGDHAVVGASITMEWSVDDFAISQFAQALGKDEIATEFQARSQNWQNLFNPATKQITPRDSSGTFLTNGGGGFGQAGFDEGNSEQYLWLVPHNIETLISAIGGKDAAIERLDTFTQKINIGANEPYLWSGNEPNFGVPWLYNYMGTPAKTQALVNRVRSELFAPTPVGKPGNDDLGAQSSWYVWASIGMYPTTSGTPILTLNTPIFDRIEMDTASGNTINITADGASSTSKDNPLYIDSMTVGGQNWDKTYLPLETGRGGADININVTNSADSTWGTGEDAAPPSFSEGGKNLLAAIDTSSVQLEPGQETTIEAAVTSLTETVPEYTITASGLDPAWDISIPAVTSSEESSQVSVKTSVSTPDGYYPVTLEFVCGEQTFSVPLMVRVATAGTLNSMYQFVSSAPAASWQGSANFDGAGNSYTLELLQEAGITPGSQHSVPGHEDVKFTWPNVPAGQPDTVMPQGQNVVVPAGTISLSLIGAGTNGGKTSDQWRVNFADGTSENVTFGFGDWVKPADGDNGIVVLKMADRNAVTQTRGAYIFATPVYQAPEGKTIVSIDFPDMGSDQNKNMLRVITVATQQTDAPLPVALEQVTLTPSTGDFTGSAHTPEVNVFDVNDELVPTDQYTVSWEGDLIAVGEHKVTVTAKEDSEYSGSVTAVYTITAVDEPVVKRLSGEDRYQTNQAVLREFGTGEGPLFLVSGRDFPDALSAAPAAAKLDGSLLLINGLGNTLDDRTMSMIDSLDPTEVVVVGGTQVITAKTLSSVKATVPEADVHRVAGSTRYRTSLELAKFAFTEGQLSNAYLVTGRDYADALVTAPAAALSGSPIILVDGKGQLSAATSNFLKQKQTTAVTIVGGSNAVSTAIEKDLKRDSQWSVKRTSGSDRYQTAVEVNKVFSGQKVKHTFVASGLNFPDALSASAVAGSLNAPIYLSRTDCLPGKVANQLSKNKDSSLYFVGGKSVLTDQVMKLNVCR